MPHTFSIQRRVEFRDTDAAGIVHFSVFFNYMEEAEHELLRSIGTSVVSHDAEGMISWPRVSVACEYRGALRFEDEFEVRVSIERLGSKSVSFVFDFVKQGVEVARGKVTAVCCRILPGEPPKSIAIPAEVADKLRALVTSA